MVGKRRRAAGPEQVANRYGRFPTEHPGPWATENRRQPSSHGRWDWQVMYQVGAKQSMRRKHQKKHRVKKTLKNGPEHRGV